MKPSDLSEFFSIYNKLLMHYKFFLGILLLTDILHGSEGTQRFTFFIKHELANFPYMSNLSCLCQDPEFNINAFTQLICFMCCFTVIFPVILMYPAEFTFKAGKLIKISSLVIS